MKLLPLHVRLFLLAAGALTPASVLALLGVPAIIVIAVHLAALAVVWLVTRRWCRGQDTDDAVTQQAREQALQADVEQRNHLLRELHHRVKNNLQMISSLLSLQADRIRSPRIRRVFAGAQNRVLTMSILHRHLYERTDWAQVDFQAFLNDLVRHLTVGNAPRAGTNVRFSVSAPVMAVGPDIAIPIGLIVTEAVSNALVHAFAATAEPRITIAATESDGHIVLSIDDNGSGIEQDADGLAERGGLGLTLLQGLSAQLGGELAMSRRPEGGTRVLVRFPSPTVADTASNAA
ncbi:sensor histidine kinase [Reyranella sp. CPCC 100927]|uniref:sensor histidine kinase n=1 Tax=Reyranella sp. CPCC 100927 TaxID=2599616 RepID=UPI0011B74D09|nr:sensor histidine kinase [Reyranella sp. CPCC 100927]TWT09990.1 sensor histidine kinase [Reyranella sp. CPCC 100927]